MARNSSGTHSLPTGNPVTTLATASSTVHNNTMSDLSSEVTDSLSRSGKGAMLAALELTDGTVAAPSLTFDSDTNNGLYLRGSDNPAVTAGGTLSQHWSSTGTTVPGTLDVTGLASFAGNLAVTASAPSSTTGFSNTLTRSNIVKAHGFVTGGSLGAQTVNGGFNVASAVLVDAATDGIVVTFGTAMANANYTVAILADADFHVVATEKATGSFKIALKQFVSPWAVQAYTQFSSAAFDFVVLGAQ